MFTESTLQTPACHPTGSSLNPNASDTSPLGTFFRELTSAPLIAYADCGQLYLIKRDTWRGRGESGQGLIEYALIAALIAIALTLALLMFQDSIGKGVDTINSGLEQGLSEPRKPGGCLNQVPGLKNPNC